MITSDYCKMMADYNAWMNRGFYTLSGEMEDQERKADRGAFFGSIHSTLNHLLYSDLAFMSRFTSDPSKVPELGVDIHEDFEDLRSARIILDERIRAWGSDVSDTWLQDTLTYTSKVDGKSRTMPRWVVVSHMFNHQTHHRGQMTTLFSQMGLEFGSTDIPFMPQFSS